MVKFGVPRVNSCTIFRCPMDRSIVLSANVTSESLTALVNVTETEIFYMGIGTDPAVARPTI